jgi:drug/metabolite transporter (DMT)-like permease
VKVDVESSSLSLSLAQPLVRKNRGPTIALLMGAVGIGFAPILVRFSQIGPSAIAGFRILLALPILWLVVWIQHSRGKTVLRPASKQDFQRMIMAGLFFAGDLSLWHWSLQLTKVANSTLLTNFAPVFVTAGAVVFFAERLTFRFIAGLALAIAGAALLVLRSVDLSPKQIAGDVIAILTATIYAGYILSVKGLRRRFATIIIMAWSGLISCPVLFLIALLSGERMLPIDAHGWYALAGLAIVSHFGGQALIAFALGHLPASFSSVSLLLQPVIAALLAAALLNEPLTTLQVAGGSITLIGIVLASRTNSKAASAKSLTETQA